MTMLRVFFGYKVGFNISEKVIILILNVNLIL